MHVTLSCVHSFALPQMSQAGSSRLRRLPSGIPNLYHTASSNSRIIRTHPRFRAHTHLRISLDGKQPIIGKLQESAPSSPLYVLLFAKLLLTASLSSELVIGLPFCANGKGSSCAYQNKSAVARPGRLPRMANARQDRQQIAPSRAIMHTVTAYKVGGKASQTPKSRP